MPRILRRAQAAVAAEARTPWPTGGMGTDREHGFDENTDAESRAIAERFAPNSAERPAPEPATSASDDENEPPRSRKAALFGGITGKRAAPAYRPPPINLLRRPAPGKAGSELSQTVLRGTARLLEEVLADFSIKGEVREIKPGPVVTLFELEPARGTKSSRVVALAEDIARSMSVTSARAAIIPGRNVIGIELPNVRRETVYLRDIFESPPFRSSDAILPLALGKSIGGEPIVVDLARMPHLLVAGTTGSGKSVGVNAMVLSLLYRRSPLDCRLLMIDPKMLELSVYNGIPHLLTPVVTDPQKAVAALNWAVAEMEERYKRMASLSVRNIEAFNARVRKAQSRGETLARTVQTGFDERTGEAVYEQQPMQAETMPYIVVVVDEFADLMTVAGKEIETAVQRLAQMARAAGIHLIMATQRPSVDIVTGTIKANFPARISFKVASKIDSRTILNEQGAEALLGQGDMLYSLGSGQTIRAHGPFVSDDEVERIAEALRRQGPPIYVEGVTDTAGSGRSGQIGSPRTANEDDLYDMAVAVVLRDRKASTSYLQRRLSIGYNRAADVIERMEREGLIGPPTGVGKREILITGRDGEGLAQRRGKQRAEPFRPRIAHISSQCSGKSGGSGAFPTIRGHLSSSAATEINSRRLGRPMHQMRLLALAATSCLGLLLVPYRGPVRGRAEAGRGQAADRGGSRCDPGGPGDTRSNCRAKPAEPSNAGNAAWNAEVAPIELRRRHRARSAPEGSRRQSQQLFQRHQHVAGKLPADRRRQPPHEGQVLPFQAGALPLRLRPPIAGRSSSPTAAIWQCRISTSTTRIGSPSTRRLSGCCCARTLTSSAMPASPSCRNRTTCWFWGWRTRTLIPQVASSSTSRPSPISSSRNG